MNLSEKQAISQLENIAVEAKANLGEQLKCIENHVNQHLSTLNDLREFLKRKAELDLDYSRKLEKLTDQYLGKLNTAGGTSGSTKSLSNTPRNLNGYQQCFYALLNISKQSCINMKNDQSLTQDFILEHLTTVSSVLKHLSEQSRRPLILCHEDFVQRANNLVVKLKDYQTQHALYRQVNAKFESAAADFDKLKLASTQDVKNKNADKMKRAEKKRVDWQMKRDEAFAGVNKKRNEYLLSIQSMNSYLIDIYNSRAPETVDSIFLGHYEWSQCVFKSIYLLQEECVKRKNEKVRKFYDTVKSLRLENDVEKFLNDNTACFSPKETLKFVSCPHSTKNFTDDITVLCLDSALKQDYDQTKGECESHLQQVAVLDKKLSQCKLTVVDTVRKLYLDNSTILDSFTTSKEKSLKFFSTCYAENIDVLSKLHDSFLRDNTERTPLANSLIRLKGRKDLIEQMFGVDIEINIGSYNTVSRNRIRVRGAICTSEPPQLRPKYKVTVPLFGGKIDVYCATAQIDIPPVVTSCINRIVNTPGGLIHSGIFRLNGSQSEINNLKNLFEKNEDPLIDDNQTWNWNTIAGLLKLYFRELEEPVFPKSRFMEVIDTLKLRPTSESQFLSELTKFVTSLNVNVMITMRYLFDFLNLLSQYSDQNMMDDYNLAVCWGPTLLPIPEDQDQVHHHNNSIEIIKTFITQSSQIFPRNYGLLLRDITDSPGSCSEDLEETDDELDEPDEDSLPDDNSSIFNNAPDLVLDLPVSVTADSSESGENLCTSPILTVVPTDSCHGDTALPEYAAASGVVARPRATSLNNDVDPPLKASPMLASRKKELEKMGGIPLDPRAAPRKGAIRLAQSPTGSCQASTSAAGSSESLGNSQPLATSSSGHPMFKQQPTSNTVSKSTTLTSTAGKTSPVERLHQRPESVLPMSTSADSTKSFPPSVQPKPSKKN